MSSSTGIAIKSIDHVVITAKNVPKTVEFYQNVLGMTHEVFRSPRNPDVERHSLVFGSQKLNLHSADSPWEPHAQAPTPGSIDLCFLTAQPVEQVLKALQEHNIEVLEEGKIVDRVGAAGKLKSVYIRDPDGNLVECADSFKREAEANRPRISNYA